MNKIIICLAAILVLSTCAQKHEKTPAEEPAQVSENSTSTQPQETESQPAQPQPQMEPMAGQEIVITTDAELRYALDELIIKAKLPEEQKSKLYDLRVELGQKLERNTVMNVKLRAMMIEEMMSESGSQLGVNMIGDMIHKNITERITLIERSIEKVNSILGYKGRPQQEVQNTQNDFF